MTLADWLWAIPVFGLMIFMHELGHFAVAKFFDIRVHEFALGFGPALVGFNRGETRYSLRAIPLGGFVRMAGMDPSEPDDPRGFNNKPIYQRALTIFAGPFMNFLLASLLLSGYIYAQGVPVSEPIFGDVLAECNGQPCPAAMAGLQKGDRVLTIGGSPVESWSDILTYVGTSEGAPLEIRFERDGQEMTTVLTPVYMDGRWMIGIQQATRPGSFWKALAQGPSITWEYSKAWVASLVQAVTGRTELELSGPVGITREIATQASAGLTNLLWLTAFLSINLGLFNLLPIPALDGSHLLFMAVEAVRGRRLDPERVNMVHFFGFLLLMGLILVVTYGDLRAAILGQ
ncbi:RIP metalloprotease RseP [Symbiobacterium thermophilum]|uniref:Zinc metalloprotease n=1 Tax=Symbiobacterium thermophilum TaxID=2734 RepID=A0A953I5T9_SYMTR|nr:RIP metalloprotease RseP [Symbiobacterium thermophilum]MBY6278175.1 RIP metalloprotease RseP [Symbiobacterium thermophilum]